MRVLGLIIMIRVFCHLNLHKSCLSFWWPYIICFVTSVTLHKSLFCHFGGYTQVCSWFWEVNFSYRSISIWPAIVSDQQGQWSVQIYRASDWSISSGPVIGLFLQGLLSVYLCQPKYWSVYFTTYFRVLLPIVDPVLRMLNNWRKFKIELSDVSSSSKVAWVFPK